MLFQRLYNWIKYKTLPPSFLFKNRLFVERDSKHRRVLSNFGLTYRNSKWSNYETYNIKLQFKNSYYRFFFSIVSIIIFFFVVVNFDQYYIFSYFFNNLTFCLWIGIDTLDYYVSFLVWFFTITVSMILNLVYSYLFFNNFSENTKQDKLFSNNFYSKINVFNNTNSNDKFISKHDLSTVLYSWLSNKNQSKSKEVIEGLFDEKINLKKWNEIYDFFSKLYKISFYLKISNVNKTELNLNSVNTLSENLNNSKFDFNGTFLNSKLTTNYFTYFTSFVLNNSKTKSFNYSPITSINFLNNRFDWNLYNFNNELNKNSFLIKSKIGFFFFSDINYSKLNYLLCNFNEFWVLNQYMKNQLNVSKWNRWLYKYSILHRKVLKNSHKLTLTKKIISSPLTDSKLFDKNIWNNQFTSKYSSTTNTTSLNSLIFGTNSFFNFTDMSSIKSNVNGNQLVSDKITLLKFHENSYFWFLKRFYLFNTLDTNFILSKNKNVFNHVKLNESSTISDKRLLTNNLYNFFIKSFFLSNYNLTNLNNSNLSNLILENSKPFNLTQNFLIKDLTLNLNEIDILSKDNLNCLYWFTSNLTYENKFVFFDYLYSLSKKNHSLISFKTPFNNTVNEDLKLYLFLTSINLDEKYLNDFFYFTLFN